jgi:3D (Asp-Asp-Asp) domain-containing protein
MKMTLLPLLVPLCIGQSKVLKVEPKPKPDNEWRVTLTTYTVDSTQTDSTPLVTASGFKLDSINPSKHRIIAVSRDLKRKFKFGSKVKLQNAGRYNGVWYIRDVMNKRFSNKIDILVDPKSKHTLLHNVLLIKI